MDNLGVVPTIAVNIFGTTVNLNYEMFIMTYVVIGFLALTAFLGDQKIAAGPAKNTKYPRNHL